MTTYPTGYGQSLVSLDRLHAIHAQHGIEPEYARRLFAWLRSRNGQIGIGGSWRPNPSSISPASRAGHSFHQTQRFNDGSHHFCAVDLVARNGGRPHRTLTVTESVPQSSPDALAWGLHMNVGVPHQHGYESWHMQPVEIDGYQSWANRGRRRPRAGYPLPHTAITSLPAVAHASSQPPHHYPRHTIERSRHNNPGDVKMLQTALRKWSHEIVDITDPGNADGDYGPRTTWSLATWQTHFGIHADGIYGPVTEAKWVAVCHYLEAMNSQHD